MVQVAIFKEHFEALRERERMREREDEGEGKDEVTSYERCYEQR